LKLNSGCPIAPCIRTKFNTLPCPQVVIPVAKQINRFTVFQDGETPTNLVVAVDNTAMDEFAKLNYNTDALANEMVQKVKVYDVAGNLVLENDNIADKVTSIDMSALAEGSYYVQVEGNKEYREQQNFKFTVSETETMLAEDIATGNIVINTPDADDRKEVMKHQLYKELRSNYDLLNSSSLLQDFYTQQQNTDIGMINKINDAFNNFDVKTAQSLIANWQPQNRQGQNCLDFYNHFIGYLNGEKPSEDDIKKINTLANSNPQIEGEIVLAARTLYNYLTQAGAIAPVCNHYRIKQIKQAFKTVHIEIAKNITSPCYARMAKDESPLTTETIEAILIYNKGGEVVKKIGVENLDTRMTDIDLSDLDEGTYSMEIRGLKEYKEMQTFRLTANSELSIAEDIATGNVIINKTDADARLYVMQQQLYNELQTTKSELVDNSKILALFVEKQKGGNFGLAFNINNLLENDELDKAKELLSLYIPTNQIDKNYISYFNYYIRFKNGDSFGDDETQDMFDLASMCPLTSGEIINAQRTLYYFITKDNTSFDYTCNAPDATCIRTLNNPDICINTSTDPKRINRFKVFQDGDTPTNLDVMVDKTTLDEFAKLNFNTDDLLNEQVQNVRVFDAAGNLGEYKYRALSPTLLRKRKYLVLRLIQNTV